MANHNKNKSRGLLILLLLLLFVAKDKIMEMFSPCACEPEDSPGTINLPPTPDYPVFGSASKETLEVDIEEYERAEDSDVTASTGDVLFRYSMDPSKDLFKITKTLT